MNSLTMPIGLISEPYMVQGNGRGCHGCLMFIWDAYSAL